MGVPGSAALLVLSPLKALLHAVFTVEYSAMHVAHVVAGLGFAALPVSGLVSGSPVLTHAALAPFAMMGTAQALMHSNKPVMRSRPAQCAASSAACRRWRNSAAAAISLPPLR